MKFLLLLQVCYLNCIKILLQNGANPNCCYRSLTPLHVLCFTVSENFTLNCDIQKRANFDFIKNILLLLLQYGLDCNKTSQNILQSTINMMQSVRTRPDIMFVFELNLILIQYGADPNISLSNKISISTTGNNGGIGDLLYFNDASSTSNNPSSSTSGNQSGPSTSGSNSTNSNSTNGNESLRSSFRNNARNYLLFYYIMLITRKEFILTDPELTYKRIIYLFYYTMKHETLFNCLKCLHNLFIAQVPNKSIDNLITLITTLYKKPRTLKQLCRVCIYNSVDHKIAQNINRLNLPGPLSAYVLNFDV